MDKKQEATKSMAHKSVGEVKKHETAWQGNKIIGDTLAKIEALLAEIEETVARQNRKTEGYTVTKDKYRANLNFNTDIFFGIFRSFAKTNNDEILYQESKLSLSDIKAIKDTEIMVTVNKTKKYAEDHKDQLKDYGLTDKMIEEYGKEAHGYINYLSTPQEIIAERATATTRLKELFAELVEQFTDYLDNHMVQFKAKDPQFYNDYLNARVIFDEHTTHLAVYGNITDEISKLALQYVAVTIIRMQAGVEAETFTKLTTKTGYFRFKSLKPDTYKIRFELDGYDTLELSFTLYPLQSRKFNEALRVTE